MTLQVRNLTVATCIAVWEIWFKTHFPFTGLDDYSSTMMDLTFDSGNQDDILCVDVPINNDTLCETDEMFNVTLTTLDSAVILDPSTGTVTIVDDDGKYVYS